MRDRFFTVVATQVKREISHFRLEKERNAGKNEGKHTHTHVYLVTQSCLTLCDFKDFSPPGSFVYGILQTRMLEWVAVSFSKGSS